MSIVTKTGDTGETSLYGGRRVRKDDARIHAYGTVDELNAVIGLVLAEDPLPAGIRSQLTHVQHLLFRVGGDLATPMAQMAKQQRVADAHTDEIGGWIADLERELPPQMGFILPGGMRVSALLHLARTVCRRAERHVVELSTHEELNPQILILLNRLGDYFFIVARQTNAAAGVKDVEVEY